MEGKFCDGRTDTVCVIRLQDGESMASLCREFGISRKTGYKIFERYEECGLEGLTDRARLPTPARAKVISDASYGTRSRIQAPAPSGASTTFVSPSCWSVLNGASEPI
jgi:helix-turn-helix protein